MSEDKFKFKPFTDPNHPYYDPIIEKKWFRAFNHWANPFGNWHEPLPFPEKWAERAKNEKLPNWIWWNIRNPLHNLTHFILGITPVGERYEWLTPEDNGWEDCDTYWKKGWIRLPKYDKVFGWQKRGNIRLGKPAVVGVLIAIIAAIFLL